MHLLLENVDQLMFSSNLEVTAGIENLQRIMHILYYTTDHDQKRYLFNMTYHNNNVK